MSPSEFISPWLDLSLQAASTIGTFLREGSASNRGYELFRFLLLPLLWPIFALFWLRQVGQFVKSNGDITWPRMSGLMWLVPLWLAYLWPSPQSGLYLGAFTIIGVHLCLWHAGMFRWRLKKYQLGLSGAAMAVALYLIAGHLGAPHKRGLPQEQIIVRSPSALIVAKTMAHHCSSEEGCATRLNLQERVTLRHLRDSLKVLSANLTKENCQLAGHSPLGLIECPDLDEALSPRALISHIYGDLPSSKCKMRSWVHEGWQPSGFWPENPPLSLLATRREELLECPTPIGYAGKQYSSAKPTPYGTFYVSAQEAVTHDWAELVRIHADEVPVER